MHKKSLHLLRLTATLLCLAGPGALADELHVAVASNFRAAMSEIERTFEAETDHSLVVSYASTGKHFAQIVNGAPFDVFLAADVKRPDALEREGLVVPGTRFTYAFGKLVLWSPKPGWFGIDDGGRVLTEGVFDHLAIANPKLAPYGRAAEETLRHLGLWENLQDRIVRGENIAQAYQYVYSGNAELGFVSASLNPEQGSVWLVPEAWYSPVEQQAVLLVDELAGRAFIEFMKSKEVQRIIGRHGYKPGISYPVPQIAEPR